MQQRRVFACKRLCSRQFHVQLFLCCHRHAVLLQLQAEHPHPDIRPVRMCRGDHIAHCLLIALCQLILHISRRRSDAFAKGLRDAYCPLRDHSIRIVLQADLVEAAHVIQKNARCGKNARRINRFGIFRFQVCFRIRSRIRDSAFAFLHRRIPVIPEIFLDDAVRDILRLLPIGQDRFDQRRLLSVSTGTISEYGISRIFVIGHDLEILEATVRTLSGRLPRRFQKESVHRMGGILLQRNGRQDQAVGCHEDNHRRHHRAEYPPTSLVSAVP